MVVIILYHVRQSSRRVTVITITAPRQAATPNSKRELKIMQNMSLQSSIISFGGVLYLVLVIWLATQQHSPPESFYLLAINLISIFTALMMIALFLMNKAVKTIALNYIHRRSPSNTEQMMTHQQLT